MSINSVEEVKNRLNIADVIGDYLKLERAGVNFKALCPFHNEKTPSFFISPDRGTYYCFGCGAKGDVISFIENFEGLDFIGAMKILAERAGVPFDLKPKNPRLKTEKNEIYKIVEKAQEFFVQNLNQNSKVKKYLIDRGLTEKTISDWKIGYALPKWRTLKIDLNNQGFEDKILIKAGLVKKSENGQVYDTFRDRITFPLNDSAGRVVAFSGRIFSGQDNEAKYLNSPETVLFKKSTLLYGFDKGKLAIRKYNFAILVEGQFDLILSHQAGFRNTIATSGTSLTREHLIILKRLTNNLLIAYDSDKAGLLATKRAYILAIQMGFSVKSLQIPTGQDPADLIKADPENWKNIIKNSISIPKLILDNLKTEPNKERLVHKLRLQLWPIISAIPSESEKHRLINSLKLSILTGIREDFLMDEIKKTKPIISENSNDIDTYGKNKIKNHFPFGKTVELLLGILLLKEQDEKILNEIKSLIGKEFEQVETYFKENNDRILFEVEEFLEGNDVKKALKELAKNSIEQILKNNLNKKMIELSKTDEGTDKHTKLLIECQEISKKLKSK